MTDHNSGSGLKRAELARLSGCNIETIRYYEKTGMMNDPREGASGYRFYEDFHVRRLRFILRARELGFSIRDIRGLLSLMDDGTQTCVEVKERTERHLSDVRRKIADLKGIEAVLSETASLCTGDQAPQCAILDALSL